MEASPKDDGLQRKTFVQIEPSQTVTKTFAVHVKDKSPWDSSDEEEEEEDEDEEEEDGYPVAPGHGWSPGIGQNLGRLSAQGSPYRPTTYLNQLELGKRQRYLPRPPSPDRGYGMCLLRTTLVS